MSAQDSSEHCRADEIGEGMVSALRVYPIPPEDATLGVARLVRDRGNGRVVYMTVTTKFANILLTALSLPTSILVDIFKEATYLPPIGAVANIFQSLREGDGASGGDELQAGGNGPVQEAEPEPEADEDVPSPPPKLAEKNGAAAGVGDKKKRKVYRKRKALKAIEKQALVVAKPVTPKRTPAEERLWHLHIYKQLVMHQDVELSKISRKQYRCPNAATRQNCSILVSDVKGRNCMQCRAEMTVEIVPNNGLVVVKDASTVVFTENLKATPLRNENTFMELVVQQKELQDMSRIEMCDIDVGIEQVLKLAHAALKSRTPLTDVFGAEEETIAPV